MSDTLPNPTSTMPIEAGARTYSTPPALAPDIEIARQAKLKPIVEIAKKIGIEADARVDLGAAFEMQNNGLVKRLSSGGQRHADGNQPCVIHRDPIDEAELVNVDGHLRIVDRLQGGDDLVLQTHSVDTTGSPELVSADFSVCQARVAHLTRAG